MFWLPWARTHSRNTFPLNSFTYICPGNGEESRGLHLSHGQQCRAWTCFLGMKHRIRLSKKHWAKQLPHPCCTHSFFPINIPNLSLVENLTKHPPSTSSDHAECPATDPTGVDSPRTPQLAMARLARSAQALRSCPLAMARRCWLCPRCVTGRGQAELLPTRHHPPGLRQGPDAGAGPASQGGRGWVRCSVGTWGNEIRVL